VTPPASIRLLPPAVDGGGEFVALREAGGEEEIVHLHDYARVYSVPGLYEHIVQDLLHCRSPQVASAALERHAPEPTTLRVLDLGAGTGLVGELIRRFDVGFVVGMDAIGAAREACLRDRPGIYDDYLVGELAALDAPLRAHRPNALVAAGAFGGTHMPASALAGALTLLPEGAPVVFTIDERWTQTDEPGGFLTPLARMIESGELVVLERARFLHRVTTGGEPIHYELFAASNGTPARSAT
jgi:predicted TPR repeat methyltransferase